MRLGGTVRGAGRRAICFILLMIPVLGACVPVASAAPTRRNEMQPTGLQLVAQPGMVDVGYDVLFTLTAKAWNGPAGAYLTFVSPHHGFSGSMQWENDCACFRIAVALARRIHPLETAHATVTVTSGGRKSKTGTTFQIRGLAPNGKDFAPGGAPSLTAWVGDPAPLPLEKQHYCAWVKTADGLGVAGEKVRIIAHFKQGQRTWTTGPTSKTGVACIDVSIGHAHPGYKVSVDMYAGNMHATAAFTPRP